MIGRRLSVASLSAVAQFVARGASRRTLRCTVRKLRAPNISDKRRRRRQSSSLSGGKLSPEQISCCKSARRRVLVVDGGSAVGANTNRCHMSTTRRRPRTGARIGSLRGREASLEPAALCAVRMWQTTCERQLFEPKCCLFFFCSTAMFVCACWRTCYSLNDTLVATTMLPISLFLTSCNNVCH